MLDVASGKLVAPAMVVVEGDRIRAIGGQPPAGARVIELGDTTLLPGFIDAHTHLTLPEIDKAGWQYDSVLNSPVDDALRGVRAARETLLAGFTTVRDVGARGFADVKLGQGDRARRHDRAARDRLRPRARHHRRATATIPAGRRA